ncbi:hypothetical protein [Microbacterium oleivorans]|uniref:Uncharacterized protein n=1 Tax=Microbacterium oleivorans TaxID=273677 RepID=A0A4R5YJD9_9MICO|nr:hypothetical protein [Microbacterium oleivorans]TDL45038.1 hypothetical protein E2R54_00675 [Microbacterium oleivorans]
MSDSYLATLERLAGGCESGGHESCAQTLECRVALDEMIAARKSVELAAKFDAGRERLGLQFEQPSETWTTTALLRTARDLLLTPPTANPWWRSISITTALARLGERGLSADVIVRTGFARDLIKLIVRDAAMFWSASGLEDIDTVEIPDILAPWVALLQSEPSLVRHKNELPPHIASVALAGDVGAFAEQWIRNAAVGHIVSWRIENYLRVEREPRDLVLRGGKDLTLWVTERFTLTYLPEWRASSLQWEQTFIAHPDETARAAGVPLSLLQERKVTTDMVNNALRARLIERVDEEFEQRELGDSSIAALAGLLEAGQHDIALRMAQKFHEAQPQAMHFAMAYAFCLIVIDPARARSSLEAFQPSEASVGEMVRDVNLAACALIERDLDRARAHVAAIATEEEQAAWLWDPVSLVSGDPQVRYWPIGDWVRQFAEAEMMLTQRIDGAPSLGS